MGQAIRLSVINHALCNDPWSQSYPNAEVSFLPEGNFDHSPILVQFYTKVQTRTSFKFYNYCTNNDKFLDVVSEIWRTNVVGCLSFQIQ